MAFHVKEGLYFNRNPDGSVTVTKKESAADNCSVVMEVSIEKNEWASVISQVSHEPELAKKHDEALAFHG